MFQPEGIVMVLFHDVYFPLFLIHRVAHPDIAQMVLMVKHIVELFRPSPQGADVFHIALGCREKVKRFMYVLEP